MFISKKEVQRLEKRIADLEGQVQGQQKVEWLRESHTDDAGNIIRTYTPCHC